MSKFIAELSDQMREQIQDDIVTRYDGLPDSLISNLCQAVVDFEGFFFSAQSLNLQDEIAELARKRIKTALVLSNGRLNRAYKLLGFSNYQTLRNWMNRYNVEIPRK